MGSFIDLGIVLVPVWLEAVGAAFSLFAEVTKLWSTTGIVRTCPSRQQPGQ